ncbi:hypothetical protein SAMN05444401_0008 [Clostridium amylolyticum]|uniref:LXG domain-containing protein n=1 Tax=Clostridium amylolyticum TaxID=1121298 RepID=A0A1M6MZG2_9CLOT|nr:hypothetical protein [Clostridium amylolyticum]SHJ88849.1 hypothetical protein SAMN05444401_0008 [Clostridium amylolyticum]
MVIRVNISELESKAKYADSLAKELKLKAEEINNIYYNLGGKVKSRNGIGQSILNHKTKIEAAYEKMYNISKFLFKAAENYRNAETQVEDKAKSLEAMFNFNNYNVMDSLAGLDIDAINASEISNIDNYNVGTEYSTGKSKSSGFLGGLFSAGLGIGVSIAKNLYYDPAAMAIAVSSNFLENLGVLSKGTAQSQYSKIKSLERNAEEALINKYVSNKASYYGAATITDFVSMGIGMAKAALGLKQIFAGMNGVGTGIVGAPLTGGSSFVISVASATAVAVGLVQTGYGTSVFFSSRNNFKNNYEKFKEAISEGATETGESSIRSIYDSIKKAPQYPEGFKDASNGTRKVSVKNGDVLDELRKIESGQWKKVYKDGYDANGKKISIHYFQSQSGKVFNVKVKPGWSNK